MIANGAKDLVFRDPYTTYFGDFANDMKVPLVIFMGGGYSKPIKYSVDSFVDLFNQCSEYATLFN